MPKNYRPVALTSHIVKVFERVLRHALVSQPEKNNLLPDGQHGFRAMRSTLTQLLSYWDNMPSTQISAKLLTRQNMVFSSTDSGSSVSVEKLAAGLQLFLTLQVDNKLLWWMVPSKKLLFDGKGSVKYQLPFKISVSTLFKSMYSFSKFYSCLHLSHEPCLPNHFLVFQI